MRSSRNKRPPIVAALSTEIMAVHNFEGLTVSVKLLIQALNVTSLTARKPNDVFLRDWNSEHYSLWTGTLVTQKKTAQSVLPL